MKKHIYLFIYLYWALFSNLFGSGFVLERPRGVLLYYNEALVGNFILANEKDDFAAFFFTGDVIVEVSGVQSGKGQTARRVTSTVRVEDFLVRVEKSGRFDQGSMEVSKLLAILDETENSASKCYKAALFLPSMRFNGDGDLLMIECEDLAIIECNETWRNSVSSREPLQQGLVP